MTKEIKITWSSIDIEQQAKDMNVVLTEQQVSDVLDYIKDNHDATVGINWDVISDAIDEILQEES